MTVQRYDLEILRVRGYKVVEDNYRRQVRISREELYLVLDDNFINNHPPGWLVNHVESLMDDYKRRYLQKEQEMRDRAMAEYYRSQQTFTTPQTLEALFPTKIEPISNTPTRPKVNKKLLTAIITKGKRNAN